MFICASLACLLSPGKSIRSPETEVTDGRKLPCKLAVETGSFSRAATAEPSFQPLGTFSMEF